MFKKYFFNIIRVVLLIGCYCFLLVLGVYFGIEELLTLPFLLVWLVLPFLVCLISKKKLIKSYLESFYILLISIGLLIFCLIATALSISKML